uniref:Cubilin n=1 Tax=Pyxicephalus adspersus TaxID=30357 RepID=A0AAV3AIX7_PYXAD|nr:TPA: hypothetical protein GDO54_012746 [Pyxicephalus adspersus]
MASEDGNLIFSVNQMKCIEFKTGLYGKIKVNDDDLTDLLAQIHKNREEIFVLKASVLGNNESLTNQIAQLSTKTINRKACDSNPCQNSGTCLNLLDSFFCLCTDNWQGPVCADDVDECQKYGGTALGCQNGGICKNTPGYYSCTCTPEWYGPQCTSKYDDCKAGSAELCGNGTCTDLDRVQPDQRRYSCVCNTGWMSPSGTPACTADIDECSLPNPPCSQNPPVQCSNTPGSFICGPCPAGWTGNGFSCQDIDECLTDNSGCSVVPLVKCMNTMGSYHCGPCPPGYEGDGKTCNQIDVCSVNNGECHPLAACAPSEEGSLPVCVCPPGYAGNGYGPSGCKSTSDICQKQNPCVNGECKPSISGYKCECYSGWSGVNCSENINACSNNPCQNGGICVQTNNGYNCNCSNGWAGFHCEIQTDACGGVLIGLNGTLSYPSNPGNETYNHNVSCSWVIKTEADKILHITFPYFDLEGSYRCSFDFLQIHDGDSSSAFMLGKFCNGNVPTELFSSHNALYIWFKSDAKFNAGGFRMTWESRQPECGGHLSNPEGSIFSPGYPGNYPPNRDCYWTISTNPGFYITFAFGTLNLEHHNTCENDYLEQAGPMCGGNFTDIEGFIASPSWPNPYTGDKQCIYVITQGRNDQINLRFTHVDLQSSTGCSLTTIEIRDGGDETAPLIGRYCNNTIPSVISSSSNTLWVEFKSEASAIASSFRAFYQVACGGSLSGAGVIRTPHYPNPYYRERTCEWIITQPNGEVVVFTFDSFGLLPGTDCSTNYVEVRDGSTEDSTLIGKYCGSEVPLIPAYSTQTSLYVKFVTDASPTNHGFSASYSSLLEGCGGTITTPQGNISSPDHPAVYPHSARCTWFISMPPGNHIQLTFTKFNLEQAYACQNDYLEIYDNAMDATGNKIGRFCGRSIHPSITSSSNRMVLLFVSDSRDAAEGFSASYVSINASTACDVAYTEATGVFTSPNYPNNYPNNKQCVYTITAEFNKQIMLNFTDFKLQTTTNCTNDYVEIRDGGYEVSPLLGRFCKESPPLIISHSNKLWVKFKSDSGITYKGFSAYWDTATTGCGSTLTALSGVFSSPNYPMPYYENSECYWHLSASRGNQIEIQFESFHLESHKNCVNDYLAIYDGNSTNSALLEKLCGSELPAPIRSTSSDVYVKLRTDNLMSYSGFLATYQQTCQGVLINARSSGVLESLNYPNTYPNNQNCSWTIQTTMGNTISYTFTTFQLEPFSCSYDYVQLYDGPNNQANLTGKYCSDTLPPEGTTNGSSLHVVFRSDESIGRQGFQLMWNVNGCGGELSGPIGSFSSPGYPMKYPNNRECIWYIRTSPGSSIQVTILDFNIEHQVICNYDVLEIYGGHDLSSPRLAQLCSTRTPDNPLHVSSTGNVVTVRFKTDALRNGKGFNATWQEIPGGCGGVFQAPHGEIHSPNYPRPYEDHTECSWLIRVDPGHRVLLTFTDFDVESHTTCNSDSVTVYDGESDDAVVLKILCGSQIPNPLISSQNTMFVRLQSDHSNQHRGFSARFSEACGSSIVTDSIGGVISSPSYPANYPNNQNCTWIIQASEPFNHVTLSFTDFQIEDRNTNCSEDFVEIFDGNNYGSPSKGRYCGQGIPHPVTSFTCGGDLHMENGIFDSPAYPENYPENTECVWNILSAPGNRLTLSFISFSLQRSENCSTDYLEIREDNATGTLIGRFCGDSLPNNVSTIVGHILWVKFVSDGSVSGPGFRASFSHVFGNEIEGTYGQIASPLWPREYPHHSNYIWKINVQSGQIIEIRVLEIDIEDQAACSYDKLRIYDGPDVHYHIIGTYCGVTPPPSLFSFGSSVTVQFTSDNIRSGKGFLLEWTAVQLSPDPLPTIAPGSCGGVLMTGDAPLFLFSPGWPNNYISKLECTWVIRSPESTIELNILTMDIEDHSSCNNDKLVIRDGDNNLAPEIRTICGKELPGPIRSSGNAMFLKFSSDSLQNGKGFNASYHKSCGGYLHANRGLITSPNYPENYPANQNCTWHVVVTPGFTVVTHFDPAFEIENSDTSCNNGEYIELRNGPDGSSPALGTGNGKLCGRDTPSSMHTTDNELLVQFISDSSNEAKGFKLHYEAKSLACGGTIYVTDSNPSGNITSPKYPSNYPPNTDCVWIIIVPNAEAVELKFQDQFYIEPSVNCTSSFLELRDGPDANQRLLAKLCGNTLPTTYKSLGTSMYLRLRTEGGTTRAGFNAHYSIASCGGTLFGQSGIIQSLGYPSKNYTDSLLCDWFFNGPTGHYLTITFMFLDLQDSTDCTSDYIEIREYNSSGKSLGKFCGNTVPSVVRTSDSFAYVKFVSDGSVNAKGFQMQYEASIEECGGERNGIRGTLSSPNYPNLYPHDRNCEWRITVPEGRRVTLTLHDLQVQDQPNCIHDYVAVYNGYQNQSPLLDKLCGNIDPNKVIKSSGNTMRVLFNTDGSVSSGGFQAEFTSEEDAVCGGTLSEPAGGNFTSPGYNQTTNYTRNLNCEWVIQNPNLSNSTTFIEFKRLQLEPHPNCLNDFIEIRIDDANGELISRVCGGNIPFVPLALVAPRIWVHFVSNAQVEDIGFHAEYSFTGCGGIQSGVAGVISSPNYPGNYTAGSNCAWHLEAPEGQIITLSFAYFHLEYHIECRWDSLTIVNGALPSSPPIGQYCGSTSPGTVQSGTNKLLVIFNADNTIHEGGFYANWTADSEGCGGYIHADSGDIKSPGWPLNFPLNSRCTWTIQTHESSHLELTFSENFNIPDSSGQCERSFLKVWSGSAETEEYLLLSACMNSTPGPVVSPGNIIKLTFQSQDIPGNGFLASFTSRCGANFTKPSGRIVSPNYPDRYDNNLKCNYTIQADDAMFVVLTYLSFEVETTFSCTKDSVIVYSGAPSTGKPLQTACDISQAVPVSSKGTMSIMFTTDSNINMHGFVASYRVIRKFTHFDLETCMYDYVAVYDGSDIHGPQINKFCGKSLPPILKSPSNNLFLVFYTNGYGTAGGWRASFRETLGPHQGCGGYLTNAIGHFSSPDSNHDGKYDKNLNCVWTIAASENKEIKLTFTGFLLESEVARDCRYDFVKIFDGNSTSSNLQGTFCGNNIPADFTTNGSFLTIWFVSDSTVEHAGFNATYEITDMLCGGTFNATSAVTMMTSPESYPPFTSCIWIIKSPSEKNVKLAIQNFNLPPGLDCSENYLEISDLPVGNVRQVHKFCGNETFKIPDFYTIGRTAVVTFKSQEYNPGSGLRFTYQIANCSREYNQSFGYLKSPGWPENYPNSIECTTILRAPEGHFISLFFNAFHLESASSSDYYDYLNVTNGTSSDSPLLGTYYGNSLPDPIFPKNNVLHLLFKTDYFRTFQGYEITWTSSPSSCGGTLFGDNGSFTSPEFPDTYSNNTDCEWTIVAPIGRPVQIHLASFTINDPGDCINNYLIFYDGPSSSALLIRTFCGLDEEIAPFNSTSHQVFVKFHADIVTQPSYFRVTWSS